MMIALAMRLDVWRTMREHPMVAMSKIEKDRTTGTSAGCYKSK